MPAAAVHSAGKDRWIITAWEHCGKTWGQPNVPSLHADPVLPDCAPGQTVRVRGRLWFYEGQDIDAELAQAKLARGKGFFLTLRRRDVWLQGLGPQSPLCRLNKTACGAPALVL